MSFKNLAEFLSLLDNVKGPDGSGRYSARCPGHDDKDKKSLCITADSNGIGLKCFATCTTESILSAMGLETKDLFFAKDQPKSEAVIDKTYDYTDAEGKLVFQVVRFKPKDFRQRRPDDQGGWIWNLKGIKTVLYHLPEVVNAVGSGRALFIVEGEKDVETLRSIGCIATTSPMGAGKWRDYYTDSLINANVIVIPDNDGPGRAHAAQICKALYGKAKTIRLLTLAGEGIKDVTNWVEAGGTKEQLKELVSNLDDWVLDPEDTTAAAGELPEIDTSFKRTRDLTSQAVGALIKANDPPRNFIRAGLLSRIITDEKGSSMIEIINDKSLKGILDRCANWIKQTKAGFTTPDKPPIDVVNDVLTIKHWDLPPLVDIIETPIISADGSIVSSPGYEPKAQLYYAPTNGFVLPEIPANPTKEDVEKSIALLNDVICDFPFDDNASRTNALATIITPIIRPLIDGITPMTLFDKPQPGTGASKLADLVTIIATGRTYMMSPLKDDDEWRKTITTILLNSTPVVTFDNIDQRLHSPSLAKLLTSDLWRDRILGRSEPVMLQNRTIWMATGNNIKLNSDIARRCYKIRLDAKMPRPWQRTNFKHPKVNQWVKINRPAIIAAILTIARGWIQFGKPEYDLPTLDYIAWEKTVGNILTFAGVKDFLGNLNSVYEDSDEETTQWETFIESWHDQLKEDFYTVSELVERLKTDKILADNLPMELTDDKENKGFTRKLGKSLSKKNGMNFSNGLLIEKGKTKQRALTWRVCSQKIQSEFGEFNSPNQENNTNSDSNSNSDLPNMDV